MSILELQNSQQPIEIQALAQQFKLIEQELIKKTPGLADALITIHRMTQEHEELVNILSDEDIALLHKAHELYKQAALVQREVKKVSGAGKKKLTNQELENL